MLGRRALIAACGLLQEYFKPVCTPYELAVALARDFEWDAHYLFNFDEVMQHLKPECGWRRVA